MAYGQSSGTANFNPAASDLLLDALERIKIYAPEARHVSSGRRSINLLLTSSWSNRGCNLWKMAEVVVPLLQGVIQYNLTRDVVTVYDCYRRQYYMNGAQNYATSFTTALGSPNVTIAIPGSASPVGSYICVAVPVAVGGLLLYGFYKVIATPTVNSVTVVASANATSAITNGGVVPKFTTTASSQNVTVELANHGLVPGSSFPVGVATSVGGITLSGNYIVQSVSDASHFVILAASNALSGTSAFENGGQSSIAVQNQNAGYTDILMSPLSRTDYASQADKTAPGAPTTYWINKQTIPQFSVWPVTDATGPYEMHLWCLKQIQDVDPTGGQTVDIPPRFYHAMVLDLATDLSMKFAPDRYTALSGAASSAWAMAEGTDVENTSMWCLPLNMPNGVN